MSKEPLLVILDLDETLIHATKVAAHDIYDFEIGPYKVIKRPGLDHFLNTIAMHFKVAVWSSASDDYVKEVVKQIFPESYPLVFAWGRSRCTLKPVAEAGDGLDYYNAYDHLSYVKPLKKVVKSGFGQIERILIVDDTPSKSRSNYGNAIYPKVFTGEPDDEELMHLQTYLLTFKDVSNVRTIEKRGWNLSNS